MHPTAHTPNVRLQDEIESCERLIRERAALLPPDPNRPELLVLPIYAALPPEQQLRVFQPAPEGTRKVGLAACDASCARWRTCAGLLGCAEHAFPHLSEQANAS